MADQSTNEPTADEPTPDDVTTDEATTEEATAAPAAAVAATTAAATPARPAVVDPGTPEARANHRKVREGLVVSTKMDKTAVVAVVERVRHRRYAKTMQVTSHLYAHDDQNEAREGDRVRVQETRPLSKLKRWRIVEVLERAR
jgi:small subunit ribosomal protein S17